MSRVQQDTSITAGYDPTIIYMALGRALGQLDTGQRTVINQIYGFDGEPRNPGEVARDLGMDVEEVMQILEVARIRLGDELGWIQA